MNSFGTLQAYWEEGRSQHNKDSQGMGKEEQEETIKHRSGNFFLSTTGVK